MAFPLGEVCEPWMPKYGEWLLFQVQERDRWVPQASLMAMPDLQKDLVRKLPEEEGGALVQEARLPRVQHRDA
jgi:hypothetical protein